MSQAAAIAEVKGIDLKLAMLKALPAEATKNYQPYWALKAHLLKRIGCNSEARQACSRAIGLAEDAAIREFLLHQSLLLSE